MNLERFTVEEMKKKTPIILFRDKFSFPPRPNPYSLRPDPPTWTARSWFLTDFVDQKA